MAPHKDISSHSSGPPVWIHPADRLFDLITSFSSLRQNNRMLVTQIQGSLGRLRELRQQLSDQKSSAARARLKGLEDTTIGSRFGLTRREEEVAVLLARGKSNQAIALELGISVHTARHHTQRVLAKLAVHSRGEAGAKIRG